MYHIFAYYGIFVFSGHIIGFCKFFSHIKDYKESLNRESLKY
jgi:hypothetical protein